VGASSLDYDDNGNTEVDEHGNQLVYDAWNRLVEVKDSEEQTLATYAYDAMGRRTQETHGQTTRDLYYSAAWQVIEDREGGDVKAQQVWSAVYVDAMVLRDVDADGSSGTGDLGRPGSGLEQRLYAQTDANFNVTSVVAAQSYLGDDKPTVVRGYVTPQGQPLNNQSAWAVWNGGTWAGNLADGRPFTGEYSSTDVEWKVDGTSMGVWSFADGEWSYESGGTGAYTFAPLAPGPGELMERMEYDPYGQVRFLDWDGEEKLDGQFGWTYLHQGGRYDASAGLYDFRNRQYSPTLGRWMSADPLGYVDGMNVYGYLGGSPLGAVDPMGTQDYTAVYANAMQNPRAYPPARYPGLWGPADNLAVSEDRWWKHVKEREAPDWQTASLDPGIGFGSEALHQITLTPGRAWKFVDSFFGGGKDFLISAIVVVSVDLPHVYFGAWSTETYLSSSPIVRYYKRHGAQGEWPVVPVAPEVRDFGRALVSSDRDVQGDAWAQLGFGTLTTAVMLKVPSASRPAGPAAEMSAAERAAVNVLYRDFLRPLDDVSAPGRLSPAIPQTFARVVPVHINPTTLGITEQVFVTDAALVRGLNAAQLAEMLEIPPSSSFRIIEFPSQGVSGIAVPIRNASPGFVGNGFTSGGLPEFVIPNGPIPPAAVVRKVR
jgi:RHS repeat-associated protein